MQIGKYSFKAISLFIVFTSLLLSTAFTQEVKIENINSISDFKNLKVDSTNEKNEKEIKVHVVPHTHDDVGWLWTYLEYYHGTNGSLYSVEKIINNFLTSLQQNDKRTFIYVEMAFFSKWYKSQTDETKKDEVKKLIKEGRFEFINGGYVMHDEASTYYQDIIDQMRLGLLFLKEEFDYVPEIAWSIDPFGHSTTNAYLHAKLGFKKIVLVRIDYKEKEIRRKNKALEFYWFPYYNTAAEQKDLANLSEANFNKMKKTKIFTHITFDHYCPPASLADFVLEKKLVLNEQEVKSRSLAILNDLNTWNSGFKHNKVLLMYGCDFTFTKKNKNFENLELVMDYINNNYEALIDEYSQNNTDDSSLAFISDLKNKKIVLEYSLPSKYFAEIFDEVDSWSDYHHYDFFPYADAPYAYWTGYFTSRPYLKGLVRETGHYMKTFSRYYMELMLKNNIKVEARNNRANENFLKTLSSSLFLMREVMAICQHHDAVSGTAKELVSQDYRDLLVTTSNNVKKALANERIEKNRMNTVETNRMCIESTVNKKCIKGMFFNTEEKTFKILNPGVVANQKRVLAIEVSDKNYELIDTKTQKVIKSDVFCYLVNEKPSSKNATGKLKQYNVCKLHFEHEFKPEQIFALYTLRKAESKNTHQKTALTVTKNSSKNTYKISDNLNLVVDSATKKLSFEFKSGKNSYKYDLNHAFYKVFEKNNTELKPEGVNPSGAYIFSSTELLPETFEMDLSQSYIENGDLLDLIFLRFEQSTIVLNHYKAYENILEVESIWDPVRQDNLVVDNPRELMLVMNSDIDNMITPIYKEFGAEEESEKLQSDEPCPKDAIKCDTKKHKTGFLTGEAPEFWTDSNGIKYMRRIKDFRETWKYNITEQVASNFYPINSLISIRERTTENKNYKYDVTKHMFEGLTDQDRTISIHTDRTQSGGVMEKGQIMLIHNRYTNLDDWKGLEEPLYEVDSFKSFFKITNYIIFNSGEKEQNANDLFLVDEIINKKWIIFEDKNHSEKTEKMEVKKTYSINYDAEDNLNIQYKNEYLMMVTNEEEDNTSLLNKLISHTKDVVLNFQILDDKSAFVQVFNKCDDLFNLDSGCKTGKFRFNSVEGLNYKVEEMSFRGTETKTRKAGKAPLKDTLKNLVPMDLKLFKISFE